MKNQKADLGIGLDGDADRVVMVDAAGRLSEALRDTRSALIGNEVVDRRRAHGLDPRLGREADDAVAAEAEVLLVQAERVPGPDRVGRPQLQGVEPERHVVP